MPDLTNDETETFELSDVTVSTLGLVTRGASGEQFFLLKSKEETPKEVLKEGTMADEYDDLTVEDAAVEKATKSIWQKLLSLLKGEVEKMPMTPMSENDMKDEDMEDEENPKHEGDDMKVELTVEKTVLNSVKENTMTELIVATPTVSTDLTDKFIALQKSNEDLLIRVEKAENEAAQERDARERLTYLEKAQAISFVPVKSEDLAEQLHWLAKSDPKRLSFWEGILKSADALISDSGVFVEKGTSRSPENLTIVEKAQAMVDSGKVKTLKDALLLIPPSEASAYVNSRRRVVREA